MRSAVLRAVMVALMVPILVLGAFGGTTLVAHAHHGHGLHTHAGLTDKAALRIAAAHVRHHEHGCHEAPCDTQPVMPECDESARAGADEAPITPGGVLITIPDLDLLGGRAVTLPSAATRFVGFADCAAFAVLSMVSSWHTWLAAPPPDRVQWSGGPLDLLALSGCQRIVRTSGALLI
jgi:hypothetical protein